MNVRVLMKRSITSVTTGITLLCVAAIFTNVWAQGAQGRVEHKWLEVGDVAHRYASTASFGLAGVGLMWPQIRTSTGRIAAYHDGFRLWIGARDWTDPNGTEWEHKFSYTEQDNNLEDVFTMEFKTVCRFPEPEVLVDLLPSQRMEITCDEVDPTMGPARKIVNVVNTNLGVTMRKEILAFSQEHHDDYHVIDMTLTNTGNVDGDEEIELPNQTVEGLYLWWDRRLGQTLQTRDVIGRGATWGDWNWQDVVRDADLKSYISWQGWSPELQDWNPIGAAAFDSEGSSFVTGQDSSGQLHAIGFVGVGNVRADVSATDNSDDPEQPRTMWWFGANAANATGSPPDDFNQETMRQHYEEWMQAGIVRPTMADTLCPDGDFAHCTANPDITSGGRRIALGYGPYTLEPGESVNIVLTEAVSGLTYEAGRVIGRRAKRLWEQGDEFGDIEYDANSDGTIGADEVMDRNEWVMTGWDSVLYVHEKTIANYQSGYEIPKAPMPPSRFYVNSAAGGIELEWEYPSGEPDPPGGFEIYRTSTYFQGSPTSDFHYDKIAELPGGDRSYFDEEGIQRGIQYFYYIQAVGEDNTDPTGMTPTGRPLKSSRYYTQSYQGATSLRRPGETLADARIVPNPYHVRQTSGDGGVRFSTTPEVKFFGIPGNATIEIFTERGDLVRRIEHTDGTGDETWNLQSRGEQPVVSGIYFVSIRDNDSGDRRIMKLILIR